MQLEAIRIFGFTNGGLSINLRQLFNSVGELSSSELGERDWVICKFLLSQLLGVLNGETITTSQIHFTFIGRNRMIKWNAYFVLGLENK